MWESVTTKAGWQVVVRWIGQEREAQARDRVLAAHRQAREEELEWKALRHKAWGTKSALVAVAQQIVPGEYGARLLNFPIKFTTSTSNIKSTIEN